MNEAEELSAQGAIDPLEQFRKRLMRQAYLDFLDWACRKTEFLQEFHEHTGKNAADSFEDFRKYVTETYWGDEPERV